LDIFQFLTNTLGAALILGFLSLIFYRENIWSRWAEYSVVGGIVAYNTVVTIWTLVDYVVNPLMAGDLMVIPPVILGLLVYFQFSRKYRWIIGFPLAVMSTIGLAISLAGVPLANFIVMIRETAIPLTSGTALDIANAVTMAVAVVTVVSYFTFTREHTGVLGASAKLARYFMMLAFGAGVGMQLLSVCTSLQAVLQFLLRDWLGLL